MSKIIAAQDALGEAQACIQCLFMATNELDLDMADPLQSVANVAIDKIAAAIALLENIRADIGERPVEFPVPPAAEPKPARTKRKGQ